MVGWTSGRVFAARSMMTMATATMPSESRRENRIDSESRVQACSSR